MHPKESGGGIVSGVPVGCVDDAVSEVPIGEIPLVPSAELGVPVGYVDGGASAVPVGVMPLLTSAMLVRRVDGCASVVPI